MSTIKAVDKLCEWANDRLDGYAHADAIRFADEIEAETAEMREFCERVEKAAKARDELEVFGTAYMPLPLDADGVPIRVGDVMVDYKTPRNVVAVAPDSFMMDGYETDSFYRPGLAKNHRHVKRTLEDVLSDFAAEVENDRNTIETARKYADEIRELLGGAE